MIFRAREREIDLEHLGKRKAENRQVTRDSAKKPRGFESRLKGR